MIRQRMTLFNLTSHIYVASLPLIIQITAPTSRKLHALTPHTYICETRCDRAFGRPERKVILLPWFRVQIRPSER